MIYNEEILIDISHVADMLNKNGLTSQEYRINGKFSLGLLYKRFGSIRNAFKMAGLKQYKFKPHNKINLDNIINDIKRVASKLHTNMLSSQQYKTHGQYNLSTLQNRFGSIANAFKLAGLMPHKNISDKDILNDIRCVANKLHLRSLTQNLYQEYGKFNIQTITRRFGTLQNACEQVDGLVRHKLNRKQFTKDELLHYLRKYHNEFGITPTRRGIANTRGYPCDKVYYTYFSMPWSKILDLAGIKPTNQFIGLDGEIYDSSGECETADILYSNFIEYESHKSVCQDRKWTCDFYLPDRDLWIEYDGLGKHRRNLAPHKQKLQFYIDNGFKYVILKPDDSVLDIIDNEIIDISGLYIQDLSFKDASLFIERIHYLKSTPKGSKYKLGCFYKDKLMGVITFGRVANPKEHSLAITRLCYLDMCHRYKNFGSRFVSLALKYLRKDGYKGLIVSWSDPRFHDGGLYKACNFKAIKTKQRNDYIYVDKNGNEYHKSKCRVRAGESESDMARSMGLTKLNVPPKQKWCFLIS
jgi:hypothetical protein